MNRDATVPNFPRGTTDSQERRYVVAMGRPILACRWTVDDEGRTAARWLEESRVLDVEPWARMPVEPSANDSQNASAVVWPRTIGEWIAIGMVLAITVVGLVLGVSTEPGGL